VNSDIIKTKNNTIKDCWELIKLSFEKKRIKKKSLTIVLFFLFLNLSATTYFISPNGNDVAPGSAILPWRTLANACRKTLSGDIIFVNPGSYLETEICYLPSGVSIEGAGTTSRLVLAFIILDGAGGNQHISNVKLDGNNLDGGNNIFINGRHDVVINNCTFTNYRFGNLYYATKEQQYAIEVWYSYNVEIHHNTIEGGIRSIMNNKNLNIHHNIIGKQALNTLPEVGIYLCDADNIHIWNNKFKNLASAIVLTSYGTTIMKDVYIYCNLVTDLGVISSNVWGYGSGIQFGGLTSGIVRNIHLINNTMSANPGNRQTMIGIWMPTITDGIGKKIVIRNNIIRGFQYASILAAGPQPRMDSVFIENNIFYENAILGEGYATNNLPYYTNVPLPIYNIQQNNMVVNPLFVSSTDYHIQGTSPGRGTGIYTLWILVYHDGDNYHAPPNIGAYNGYMTPLVDNPVANKDELLIYPIPASDNISIIVKDPNFNPTQLQILDYVGRIVMEETMTGNEILHLPIDLKPGFYVVKVVNAQQKIIIQKIIIQQIFVK